MKFNKENLNKLLSEVTSFNDITLSDIPDIDLYMDQVTTLFEKKLHHLKRDEEEKIMTKTMINNYAKSKIFPPVKSKKYNKDQLILLALIYNLKQNLSLTDIGIVFQHILKDIESEEKKISYVEKLYSTFLELKKVQLETFENNFDKIMNLINEKSDNLKDNEEGIRELILLIFMLTTQANIEKRMAEKLIDNFLKQADMD
jgi:hypothetical protein